MNNLYREEILEHWNNPLNYGELKNADLIIDQINPLCGDKVRFFFKFEKKRNRKITDVGFIGEGCAISIATSSILSEHIKGKSASVLSKITGEDILKLIGGQKNFPPARLKCAFLALEAVKKIDVVGK